MTGTRARARRHAPWLAGFAAVSVIIAGCSSNGGSASSGGGGSTEKPLLSLTAAITKPVLLETDSTAPLIAQAKGFYAQEGVKVTLKSGNGDDVLAQLLAAGSVDVTETGSSAALPLVEKGAGKIIGTKLNGFAYALVGKKGIATILDIQGRSLGISGPGAISEVIPELALAKAGGDPSKVKAVPIGGNSARIAALVAGKIDVSQVHTYDVPKLTSEAKDIHVIVNDLSGQIPEFIQTFEVASNDALKNKSDALSRYVAGNLLAIRWVHDHPDDAAQLVFDKKWVPEYSLDQLKTAYEDYADSTLLPLNGTVSKADFDSTVNDMVKYKLLDGKAVAYADAVDPSIDGKALKLVGTVPETPETNSPAT